MNYTELVNLVEAKTENTFETTDINAMIERAEFFIYETMQLPVQRRNQIGVMSANNRFLTLPSDFLYMYSISVLDPDTNEHLYLLNKDTNFILEAYPNFNVTGKPKHYAQYDEDSLILGPTPNVAYEVYVHYGRYPESIVTATNTWLGDNFENALFNAVMYEAASFMKEDPDILKDLKMLRDESLLLLKNLSDGKLRQDAYRSGQVRIKPV